MKKIKALVLLSGGLDSILVVKALLNQGIAVVGLSFESYFFDARSARKAAKNLGILLRVVDFSKEQLAMLKKPKHGYGKSMNPCIDCHTLMLKMARKIMKTGGFNFVATGEVLGERPMSQNSKALKIIEKESGLKGYLLRPLSAKLLQETICERKGFVNREQLLAISGRGRKRQIKLAKAWGIKDYPAPAGGCLLTDPIFGQKLRELLLICPKCDANNIELLKLGRHFILNSAKIIVGRNALENKIIRKLARKGDILLEMKDYSGPLTLIRSYLKKSSSEDVLEKAKELTQYYSVKTRGLTKEIKFNIIKHPKN